MCNGMRVLVQVNYWVDPAFGEAFYNSCKVRSWCVCLCVCACVCVCVCVHMRASVHARACIKLTVGNCLLAGLGAVQAYMHEDPYYHRP